MRTLWQQLAIATNWPVLVAVLLLSTTGLISVWSDDPDSGKKQAMFFGIAFVAMAAFQLVNYQTLGRLAWGFYALSLALCIYTIVPFTHAPKGSSALLRVPYTNGAFAWINFGVMRLQPAELMKLSFIMVMARYLRFRSNYRTVTGLLAPFTLAMVPMMVILKQPDLGTALTLIPVLFVMLFVAGARMWHLLTVLGMGLAFAPIVWLSGPAPEGPGLPFFKYLPTLVKPYQRARVHAMFSNDPATLRETGFQQHNALIAFGSGGVSGKGLGNIPVGRHVPEAHNDMVFALIGEQFGFFGAAVVLGAYTVLFAAGLEISSATREPFGKLVAPGIVALLAGQTFLNLMVSLKLMPVTGVTLPFVSYGGSSLLASYMAVGLLLNVGQNRPIVMAGNSFEFE